MMVTELREGWDDVLSERPDKSPGSGLGRRSDAPIQ